MPKKRKKRRVKIHYATKDRNVLRGYVVGRAWPKSNKSSLGPGEGVGADGPY